MFVAGGVGEDFGYVVVIAVAVVVVSIADVGVGVVVNVVAVAAGECSRWDLDFVVDFGCLVEGELLWLLTW